MTDSLPAPHRRRSLLVVPVGALRREGDLGIGDVSAVIQLIDWARRHGVGVLQFLPITESGRDGSPYSSISSVALDPTLLDVSPAALQDLTDAEYDEVLARLDLDGLNEGDIQYARVRQLKLDILWAAWEALSRREPDEARVVEFAEYRRRERDWLEDYCAFRLLMDMEGGSELWDRWDENWRSAAGARAAIARLLETSPGGTRHQLQFYAYVQWMAARQWAQVREAAEAADVWLMGDIPFGLSYYSADVLFEPELFDKDWSGGAPPEEYFKDDAFVRKYGQNWGIPLYRWETMRLEHYQWWSRRVRKTAEVMHAYRIDHVLGFYRIYGFPWRPESNQEVMHLAEHEVRLLTNGRWPGFQPRPDDTEEQREANRQDGHRRLSALLAASPRTALIAEDLGTVPPYVRPDLASLGIPGTVVPQWTRLEDGSPVLPENYPALSFAIYATHDHETLADLWDRCQRTRREQGEECEEAGYIQLFRQLIGWGEIDPHRGYDEELRWALLAALLRSRSAYAGMMVTDLFGLRDRFNIPGKVGERNWRVRLPRTVAEFDTDPDWAEAGRRLAALIRESERG